MSETRENVHFVDENPTTHSLCMISTNTVYILMVPQRKKWYFLKIQVKSSDTKFPQTYTLCRMHRLPSGTMHYWVVPHSKKFVLFEINVKPTGCVCWDVSFERSCGETGVVGGAVGGTVGGVVGGGRGGGGNPTGPY